MSQNAFLTNQVLIAMPDMQDPNFFHSVTYICEHNKDGAMGIVINHPLSVTLGEVFIQLGLPWSDESPAEQTVYAGGPVDVERGFVIHSPLGDWESTLRISGDLAVTSSRDILEAMSHNAGPAQAIVTLGYAGWGPGQLEQEMADNVWLNGEVSPELLFDLPADQRWHAAAAAMGVDINLLSSDVGHA